MQLLMFAASLNENSCNKKLINLTAQTARTLNIEVELADFAEFSSVPYNADIEKNQGVPAEITAFAARLQRANGLVISSPEYNASTPGTLKNLIDWVSRIKPMPWQGCPILLLSASPSLIGGNRGLWCTRIPLEFCGGQVFPTMFSLASAYTVFDEAGGLKDNNLLTRLNQTLAAFIAYADAINKLNTA